MDQMVIFLRNDNVGKHLHARNGQVKAEHDEKGEWQKFKVVVVRHDSRTAPWNDVTSAWRIEPIDAPNLPTPTADSTEASLWAPMV